VIAGIVACLALVLGPGGFARLRGERSWAGMQRTVASLREQWDARPHRREPLWGEATGDRASAHYERADAAARQLQKDDKALLRLLPHRGDLTATRAGALRTGWQPVLTHLRAGAHATDVRPAPGPDAEPKQQARNLLDARWVANAAIFEARVLRNEGRANEAVQWSLDAATYGADLMRGSLVINQMIGVAIVHIATIEAWSEGELDHLDAPALDLLARGLERLDASLPETLDLTTELLMCARGLQDATGDTIWMPSAWRYGFSTRWMIGDGFLQYAAAAEDWLRARNSTWPQRKAMFTAAGDELARSYNPLAAHVMPNLAAVERNVREALAQLRMLRVAIDLHRGLDVPPLRDPLGPGQLRVKREAGCVRITSTGSTTDRPVERFVAR
jgi:hypothetical protein